MTYHPLTKRQAQDHHRRENIRLRAMNVLDFLEDSGAIGLIPKPENMSLEYIEKWENRMLEKEK